MLVLISGASSGIGRALAAHYLARGATVAAVARRSTAPEGLRGAGGRFAPFAADVTDRAAMARTVAEVERTLGPIDLAIACAGIAEGQFTPDLDLEALERMFATNALGAFNLLVPAAAAMRARGRGQIAAVSSLAALHGLPFLAGYSASKAALEAGLQGMRALLRGSGVGVTTVAPGFIATAMTAGRIAPRWCMPLDRAVARIVRAIERRQCVCRFPRRLHLAMRALAVLPPALQARTLVRFTGWAAAVPVQRSPQPGLRSLA